MRIQKSDIIYIILSLVLVVFAAGIYLLYGRMSTVPVGSTNGDAKETATINSDVEIAEQTVKAFETNLSDETLVTAQDATNQVQNEAEKTKFQERIEAGRDNMEALKTAEEDLNHFDATRYYETAEAARLSIMELAESEQRTALVERYNGIAAELGLEQIQSSQEGN